jgi:hypothetical protein
MTNAAVPDRSMMAAVERLARFMITREDADLAGVFTDTNVVIIENFAPYIFQGPTAVRDWAAGFRAHAAILAQLKPSFGPAHDFSVDGDLAYFSLPTTWTGMSSGRGFSEGGGWAFVIARYGDGWRVQNYGWAVTAYSVVEGSDT